MKDIIDYLTAYLELNQIDMSENEIKNFEKIITTLYREVPLPVHFEGQYDNFYNTYCPRCEQIHFMNKLERKPNYCFNCGQRLDWSELKD